MIHRSSIFVAVIGVACLWATPVGTADAQSGSAAAGSPTHFSQEEAADFSKQIERELAARGARVAIVFRSGQARDNLPDGVSYTHGAFWVYQTFQTPEGEVFSGYNTWNLFHGDGETRPRTESYLAEEFPYEFVSSAVVEEVGVIVPSRVMQSRLLDVLASDTYVDLHHPAYSLISNPHSPKFQNCVEFLLDIVSAAAWDTADRAQIKANLGAHFEPTEISAGPLTQIFAPMADPRLRLADHRGGAIETTTYASMSAFMTEHALASDVFDVRFAPAADF